MKWVYILSPVVGTIAFMLWLAYTGQRATLAALSIATASVIVIATLCFFVRANWRMAKNWGNSE
jgi:hypothetical protein